MHGNEGRVLQGLSSPYTYGSLTDEVTTSGACLAERDRHAYGGDVVHGLAYLHGLSLLHVDVNGRNVVIDDDGLARMTNFGARGPWSGRGTLGHPGRQEPAKQAHTPRAHCMATRTRLD